jgi:apolipoprotein D and lipocalin family protein
VNKANHLDITSCRSGPLATNRAGDGAPARRFVQLSGGLLGLVGSLSLLAGCSSIGSTPIRTADHVDLQRFMGDWYVIAHIPAFLERDAYNAVESYRLLDDGRIATTFSFNDGGFDGKRKTYHPTGFVIDSESNAVWGMRFIWPIKADYRIVYIDADYRHTIIGRNKRDYVWVMARLPQIPAQDMEQLINIIAEQGYDTSKLRMVPQRPVEQGETP